MKMCAAKVRATESGRPEAIAEWCREPSQV